MAGLVDPAEFVGVQADDDRQEDGDDENGEHGAGPRYENDAPALASAPPDRKRIAR
jgi:hypothetical protein